MLYPLNCVWLKMLYISARNMSTRFSLFSGKFFWNVMSQLNMRVPGIGTRLPVPGTRMFNWDMTFQKNFPLKSEKRVLMFRAEMYNIFNHTQFSGYNISPSYDYASWKNGILVQTNSSLGRYTSTLNPRQMSMSLRFQF